MLRRPVVLVTIVVSATLGALLPACGPASVGERPVVSNQEPVAVLALPDADVQAGAQVELRGDASLDVDGALVAGELDFGDNTELVLIDVAAGTPLVATHVWSAAGRYVVTLAVTDDGGLVGRARLPLVVGPGVEPPPDEPPPDEPPPDQPPDDLDSDGDGLPDVADPSPQSYNGLTAEVFLLDDDADPAIPEGLLGDQRAEALVDALADLTPAASFRVGGGWQGKDPGDDGLDSLPWHEDAPAASTRFAVRYRGLLLPPPGADRVVVEIGADDVGVVFLDGVPVASADDEFATDFLRFSRVPAESAPVTLPLPAGNAVPLEIVLANGDGPSSWSCRFRFLAGDVSVMNPEAVTQVNFAVP